MPVRQWEHDGDRVYVNVAAQDMTGTYRSLLDGIWFLQRKF